MERSVAGEEAPATKQGDDHFATVNVAMVQAVEKRKIESEKCAQFTVILCQ